MKNQTSGSGVGRHLKPRVRKVCDEWQIVSTHPSGSARGNYAEIDVRLSHAGAAAVEPRENVDNILEVVVDGDKDHFLVTNLAKSIEASIDLHRVHTIA